MYNGKPVIVVYLLTQFPKDETEQTLRDELANVHKSVSCILLIVKTHALWAFLLIRRAYYFVFVVEDQKESNAHCIKYKGARVDQ